MLGCAGSFPGPEAACSAYLVEADGFRLLLDFGTGSLTALQRYVGLMSVDAILLTHLHGDHMFDACSYVVVRRYAPAGRTRPCRCTRRSGAPERLAAAYGPDGGRSTTSTPSTAAARHVPDRAVHGHRGPGQPSGRDLRRAGGARRAGRWRTRPTPRRATRWCRLAQGADLFLCEASYLDGVHNPPDLHLTGREAGETATKAGVGRLVLTHLVAAWGSEARIVRRGGAAYPGPIEIARPGARYEI